MVSEIKTLDLSAIIKNILMLISNLQIKDAQHPHQIHFELLSEQGLVGYFIFILFLLSYFRKKFLNDFEKKIFLKLQ